MSKRTRRIAKVRRQKMDSWDWFVFEEEPEVKNTIFFEQDKTAGARTTTLEVERFLDGVEIEMSDSTGDNVHIRLDEQQARELTKFLGGAVSAQQAGQRDRRSGGLAQD